MISSKTTNSDIQMSILTPRIRRLVSGRYFIYNRFGIVGLTSQLLHILLDPSLRSGGASQHKEENTRHIAMEMNSTIIKG